MAALENKENKDPALSNETDITLKQQVCNRNENQIMKLQCEIETARKELASKMQCLHTYIQEKEAVQKPIIYHIDMIRQSEQKILEQNIELFALNQQLKECTAKLENHRKDFVEMAQNYEQSKFDIENCKKKELDLLNNLERLQNQYPALKERCASLEDQCSKEIEKVQTKESNDHKREIASLQSMAKRMQIKIVSLETSLQQKSDECVALSTLYDDIVRV